MFDLISSAVAQEAAPAAPQAAGFMQFLPLIVIFFIFYFLLIRPQKKKMQQEQAFLNQLEKGVEIYTKSGIIGTIDGLTEKVVTLVIAENVKIKILRSQIGGVAASLWAKPENNQEKK